MKQISKYISYNEATISETAIRKGIDNTPNKEQLLNMHLIGIRVFDVVRKNFNKPIIVTSFFRSAELNKAIGGSSKTSQHTKGMAIDMIATRGFTNAQIFNFIKDNLEFDQLIWEYGNDKDPAWVHVSYDKDNNRKQVLKVVRINGKSIYYEL